MRHWGATTIKIFKVLSGLPVLLLVSCLDSKHELDASKLSSSSVRFSKAQIVLNDRCVSCHTSGGAASFAPLNFGREIDFINQGLVVPGDLDKSKIIHRTQGYTGPGPGYETVANMPLNQSISKAEYKILEDWVARMNEDQQPIAFQPFQCDGEQEGPVQELKRLNKIEYSNTIKDLLLEFIPSRANNIIADIQSDLGIVPVDSGYPFKNSDNNISEFHIQGQYQVALKIARTISASNSYTSEFAGSCFNANPISNSCVLDFLETFGLKVFRRPMTFDEKTDWLGFFRNSGDQEGLEDLIARFLMSPQFLYHLQNSGSEIQSNVFALSDYELASKISYLLTGSMPNQALFDAAEQGKLSNSQNLKIVVDEIFANDPRVKQKIEDFYSEWFKLENVPFLDVTSLAFQAFSQGFSFGDGSEIREAMLDEVKQLMNYYIWEEPSNYQTILSSRKSFTANPELAKIYGVSPVSGSSDHIEMPAAQRSGLFTRAAFVVTGSEKTDPIHIGVKMYRDFYCEDLPDPPQDLDTTQPSQLTRDIASHREIVADKTSAPACIGCHSKINPIGFAYENFDSLGRFRDPFVENVFDENGDLIVVHNVDSSSTVEIQRQLAPIEVNNAVDLNDQVSSSGVADACFVRNYYRYASKQAEDDTKDGCRMKKMYESLTVSGGNVQDMFKAMVLDKQFSRRNVGF